MTEQPPDPTPTAEHGLDVDEPVRMTEAEERFALRLAEDLDRVLGVGIVVSDLQIVGEGPVRLRATVLAEGAIREIEGRGEATLDAYRDLVRAAAELRLERAFWRMVTDV